MSKEFVVLYGQLAKQFEKYKEFIIFELESHDNIREGLEKVIKGKEDQIEDLKEALSLPRQHYKYIENLQAEEILKQKNEVITEMASNMGVPEDKLLSIMYKAEAAREARKQVQEAINDEQEGKNADVVAGGDEAGGAPSARSPSAMSDQQTKLGADTSQKTLDPKQAGGKKQSDVLSGAVKLQRDFSVRTIQSKATADTLAMEGSLMAGPFKFGV